MNRIPRKTKKLIKRQNLNAAKELAKHQARYIPVHRYNLSIGKGPYEINQNQSPNQTTISFSTLLDKTGILPPEQRKIVAIIQIDKK